MPSAIVFRQREIWLGTPPRCHPGRRCRRLQPAHGARRGRHARAPKRRRKELLDPLVAEHHGRIVKLMGDGVLVEFASAVDAVACAVEMQNAMAAAQCRRRPRTARSCFRIGINLGDVIVEGDDLYGDGVNIAARLEAAGRAGRHRCLRHRLRPGQGQARRWLRGPGRAAAEEHRAAGPGLSASRSDAASHCRIGTMPADRAPPDKPSIAVLPFDNMSGDPEQDISATASPRTSSPTCRASGAAS